jgi:hypothetical protein
MRQAAPGAAPEAIQRAADTGPATVQRADDQPLASQAGAVSQPSAADLDQLARKILPLIKRRLAIEMERIVGR